jgi:chain length determinant protein EpsF
MTLQQLILILRAHYLVALLALFVTVSATLLVSLLLPKQYSASAAVVIDVKSPDQISGQILQGMMTPGYMATQIDIINSDRVAREVIKLLSLDQGDEIKTQWVASTNGKGEIIDWLSARLQKALDVKPSRESNVIYINYTNNDPKSAASLANAYAQAYINVNLDLRLAPARQYATFFEEQTKAAREKLEAAQSALSNYQQKNGITSLDERLDFETAKLNETSAQLTSVQGHTTDSQSKRFSNRADTLPEVMQSTLINSLKADIARLDAKLTESNVNLGRNHPQTQRYMVELSTLRGQLSAETQKITNAIDTSYQVGKERESQLQDALASQKSRVLRLNKQRDELSVMRRDVESAQRSFEAVSQKASQTNIESQVTQTNIAVLNPAVAPAAPSKPKVLLNVLVSIFLGTLFGVSLALILELTNRRIRSTEDLVAALGFPLLGSVSSASGMLKLTPKGNGA